MTTFPTTFRAAEMAYVLLQDHADRLTLDQRILCLCVDTLPISRGTDEVAGAVIAIGCRVLGART